MPQREPDADRIAEFEQEIAKLEAENEAMPPWDALVIARREWIKGLRAELARLRNERPKGGDAFEWPQYPYWRCDECQCLSYARIDGSQDIRCVNCKKVHSPPSPAPWPAGPQDVREAMEALIVDCENHWGDPHTLADVKAALAQFSPPQGVQEREALERIARELERIAREANDLANGAKFDGNKRTEREFRRLGTMALAATAQPLQSSRILSRLRFCEDCLRAGVPDEYFGWAGDQPLLGEVAQSDVQPVGWQLVPTEPTPDMIEVGFVIERKYENDPDAYDDPISLAAFRAMLAAAPAPPRPDASGLIEAAEWHDFEAANWRAKEKAATIESLRIACFNRCKHHEESALALRARAADRSGK